MKPPQQLDSADVIFWAWSEPKPFFEMPISDNTKTISIHGLAICHYSDNDSVYRFTCNADWEVENDSQWANVEEALHGKSAQFDIEAVKWNKL